MGETASSFIAKSTVKAADLTHRRTVNFNIGKYNMAVPMGKQQFADVHLARERAKGKPTRPKPPTTTTSNVMLSSPFRYKYREVAARKGLNPDPATPFALSVAST